MEKIIEKIKNLFELAGNNPNEHEATAALLKAQELMHKYKISGVDVERATDEVVYDSVEVGVYSDNIMFCRMLAGSVANGFSCRTCSIKTGKSATVMFYGHAEDAQAATEAFRYLHTVALHLAKQKQKIAKEEHQRFSKKDYLTGFYIGVHSELARQSHELMVVVPEDVNVYYNEQSKTFLDLGMSKQTGKTSKTYKNRFSFNSGKTDGKDSCKARAIG